MTTRRLTTTAEPADVAEIKLLIPLTGPEFDARITAMIPALRQEAEQLTQRALAASTWRLRLDSFTAQAQCGCGEGIALLWPPVTAVASVKYYDTAGAEQTLASGAYVVDAHSEPARVVPAVGTQWPATQARPGAVTIEYAAGYGAAAPATVKLWMAARVRAEIDGCADETARRLLNGMLDHLKVYV
ncbi:MAG: head-tail connector protein [Cetobacterium sp.]